MNVSELGNYFKSLAEKHVDIRHSQTNKHFFEDMDDAIQSLRTKGKTPAVILGPPMFAPFDDNHDNEQELNTVVLLILDKVSNNSAANDKYAAYDKCKSIAVDFISKLDYDASNDVLQVMAFDKEQCSIELVGPILDNYYGVELIAEFNADTDYEYNPDKWTQQ